MEEATKKESMIMSLKSGSFYIMKDDGCKRPQGQDAHFICDEKCTIGVADGVGGYSKRGIDAGEYARELMTNSMMVILELYKGASDEVDPQKVLELAYGRTMAKGASTACIITVKDNFLHASNVGDSGFVIIRKGEAIYQSPVQQLRFNHPYQLGRNCDKPRSAAMFKIPVEVGDVIVAGTDGLFDNMFVADIASLVITFEQFLLEPKEVAEGLARRANDISYNSSVTPFEVASKKANKTHSGGKIDDITVIVSYVQQKQEEITECADMDL